MPNVDPAVLNQSISIPRSLYRDLLRECAEVLREDIAACMNCDWGAGSTGYTYDNEETCGVCAPLRDLLKRVEAVI